MYCKKLFPCWSHLMLFYWYQFSLFKMSDLSWVRWCVTDLQIKFYKSNLMMTTWVRGRMNTWFDYQVWLRRKIRSIHEAEFCNICLGSLISWCNPSCQVTFSIELSSRLVLSLLYHNQWQMLCEKLLFRLFCNEKKLASSYV